MTRAMIAAATRDVAGALRRWRNFMYLAHTTIRLRYRRSLLGPLWIPLTSAVFVFSVSYLYSGFVATSFSSYLLHLALGWAIWQFFYECVVQGAQTFQKASDVLQSTTIEKFSFVLITVIVNLAVFALNLPVVILAYMVAGFPISKATWLIIPSLALIILSGVAATALFGVVCARYRDLIPMIQAAVRVLFFLTPILWSSEFLAKDSPRRLFADLNPLSHYVEIWRMPLLGEYPEPLSWVVTGSCTIAGLVLAFMIFARYRTWIVFWV